VLWIRAFPDIKFAKRTDDRSVEECDKAVLFAIHTLRTQTNPNYISLSSYRTVNTLQLGYRNQYLIGTKGNHSPLF